MMNAVTIEESDDERSIVTRTFRLRFWRESDRWNHAIELRAGGGWQAFARSVETGLGARPPMPSPTYQELVIRSEQGSIVAMLIGSSGPHHYSATMRVICTADDPQTIESASLRVDVADRCRSETVALASTYSVHPPAGSSLAEGSMPSWGVVDQEGRNLFIRFGGAGSPEEDASKPPKVSIGIESGADFEVQASAVIVPGTATQRLVYAWTVERNPR